MIRAVLFDCDGVLVTTVEMHARALREAMAEVCPDLVLSADDEFRLNGLSTREKIRWLATNRGLRADLHEPLWQVKQSMTADAVRAEIRPDYEKRVMLERLRQAHYRTACVSNSIRETTRLLLISAALDDMFDLVLSNEDVPRQKPAPDPYLKAMLVLGVKAEHCLGVEDAPHGIESLKQSGAHVMRVTSYKEVTSESVQRRIEEIDRIVFGNKP